MWNSGSLNSGAKHTRSRHTPEQLLNLLHSQVFLNRQDCRWASQGNQAPGSRPDRMWQKNHCSHQLMLFQELHKLSQNWIIAHVWAQLCIRVNYTSCLWLIGQQGNLFWSQGFYSDSVRCEILRCVDPPQVDGFKEPRSPELLYVCCPLPIGQHW